MKSFCGLRVCQIKLKINKFKKYFYWVTRAWPKLFCQVCHIWTAWENPGTSTLLILLSIFLIYNCQKKPFRMQWLSVQTKAVIFSSSVMLQVPWWIRFSHVSNKLFSAPCVLCGLTLNTHDNDGWYGNSELKCQSTSSTNRPDESRALHGHPCAEDPARGNGFDRGVSCSSVEAWAEPWDPWGGTLEVRNLIEELSKDHQSHFDVLRV